MDMVPNQQEEVEFSKKELPKERKNLITQLVDASMLKEKNEIILNFLLYWKLKSW